MVFTSVLAAVAVVELVAQLLSPVVPVVEAVDTTLVLVRREPLDSRHKETQAGQVAEQDLPSLLEAAAVQVRLEQTEQLLVVEMVALV
jgi:hypothetical protein